MGKEEIKNALNVGLRVSRLSWPKGYFIFLDRANTLKDQDWMVYHDGLQGDDWFIIY